MGHYAPFPLVTLVFLKVEEQNLATLGILMCFLQNGTNFQIQGFYDVIIGNMEGLATLWFFKVERQNLVNWGILMSIFRKTIYFKIQGFYDVFRRHHNRRILERPCNFSIFEGRSPKFCKLYYFDVFS